MTISFYSYKGGVGRTFLAANLAACLCYRLNKKVLIIDWDLEAPGMNFYFNKGYEDLKHDGLIDVFAKYVELVKQNSNLKDEKELPRFTAKNIVSLTKSLNQEGRIDLIPAGNYSDFQKYLGKVLDFNWSEFYSLLDGKRYIEFIKKELKKLDYDYIFIDSRTGLNDYADICNIQMPDMNILVCAPNRQNIDGTYQIANKIVNSPYVLSGQFRKPIALPILSRVEREAPEFSKYLTQFRDKFQFLLDKVKDFQPSFFEPSYFFKESMIGYNRFVAVGENLLFNENSVQEREIYGTTETFLYIASVIQDFKNTILPNISSNGKNIDKDANVKANQNKVKSTNLNRDLIFEAKKLIAKDDLSTAINLLLDNFRYDPDYINHLIILSSRFHALKRGISSGQLDYGTSQLERDRLTSALLNLVDDIHLEPKPNR